MKTVYTPRHLGHCDHTELNNGRIVPAFEKPERAEMIRAAVEARGFGRAGAADGARPSPVKAVHHGDYVDFLARAWDLWLAEGRDFPALPSFWRAPGMRAIEPETIDGKLGHFSFDAGCCLVAGSWDAIAASADVALTGVDLVAGGEARPSRSAGRPATTPMPGRWAAIATSTMPAVAAQAFLDKGARRVAVLDVDYHHGNGTQSIFYERADVLVCNIHGDPMQEYPLFPRACGRARRRRRRGLQRQLSRSAGAPTSPPGARRWRRRAAQVTRLRRTCVVVSLGVDTYKDDPISQFRLDSPDYLRIGARIAAIGLPTLFVMEGGYAVEAIGVNVANTLEGFLAG